jgi:hypothetical protein
MKLIRNTETGEILHATTASAKDLAATDEYEFVEVHEAEVAEASEVEDVETVEEATRPNKSAKRADWDAYAESIGIDPSEYETKDDLIEAVEG